MSTIKKNVADGDATVTDVYKLGKGAENISAFGAGSIFSISGIKKDADNAIAPLIAAMFDLGIRGEDWKSKRGFATTAAMIAEIGEDNATQHTLEYQERLAWYGKACYDPEEQIIVDAPTLKKTDFETEGEFLIAGKERKRLQDRPATKMKNLAKRFDTLAKRNGEIEVVAKKGADNKKKTALEQLGQQIQNAIAIIQSDKPMPDSAKRDDMASQLLSFQRVHKLPTTK